MHRPRLKQVFPPMPIDDRTIAIGGADFGLAAELVDDDERHVWHLLALLDGSRSFAQVTDDLQRRFPDLTEAEVRDAVQALTDEGYIEDAQAELSSSLTARERIRYSRNIDFFSFFARYPISGHDLQERLARSRVTVLGLGGLGSFVALELAAAGVGELLLVDDDVVEEHNLNRQILYTSADVGRLKVDAARERLLAANPLIKVDARNLRVASTADARSVIHDRDLVVCAADRPRIRIYEWLNEASLLEGVAWFRGANDGLTVNSFLHVPGVTACFECEQRRATAKYTWFAPLLSYARDHLGDRTVNPCIAPVAGLIGSLTAFETIKFLSGAAAPVALGRKVTIDLQDLAVRATDGVRDADCPQCGDAVASRPSVRTEV